MSCIIRKSICEKIHQITRRNNVFFELETPLKKAAITSGHGKPVLQWSIKGDSLKCQEYIKKVTALQYDSDLIEEVRSIPDDTGKAIDKVEFILRDDAYVQTLLRDRKDLVPHRKQHTVFEYSSPNIAKPFHVGHLRSTIIGNVLANLHQSLGYPVTKMNYLGDWGTQFGMLQVGVELMQVTDEQMQKAPIETLYKAYVEANNLALTDDSVAEKARNYFKDLENGNQMTTLSNQWQKYREYTINELAAVYKRVGVAFDVYDWESQYSQKQITDVLQRLEAKGLILPEKDGRKVVEVDNRRVPIIKSDGTTLYLARDIAALLDRWHRFQFDKIYYVVENGQTDHFKACFQTFSKMQQEVPDSKLNHVKFGRIHGMSTRKGQAVFLKDLLDEARDVMHEKQSQSPTTKVDLSSTDVADVLGVSAVIINDLKQRRQRDYEFAWDKALQMNGDTGIKLQYTHCRLSNLMEQNRHIDVNVCDISPKHLREPEAMDLLYEIARYQQILWQSKEHLEACILVNYLFALCNSTSRALKRLPVKTESDSHKQIHRLLLFQAVKSILKEGMEILGLKPLTKM